MTGGVEVAYVGLGSNLGDRAVMLDLALEELDRTPGVVVRRRAGRYESEPVGVVDQPWFLNTVVELETTLAPRRMLEELKRIEHRLGRRPTRRWGERLVDLDLLLFGDRRIAEPDLMVPHPELWRRLFVLAPLAELVPDLRAPDGRSIGQVIAELGPRQAIRTQAPARA